MKYTGKAFKNFTALHNVAGKFEKGLVIAAFAATAIKIICAIGMDATRKSYKPNRK